MRAAAAAAAVVAAAAVASVIEEEEVVAKERRDIAKMGTGWKKQAARLRADVHQKHAEEIAAEAQV